MPRQPGLFLIKPAGLWSCTGSAGGAKGLTAAMPNTLEIFVFQQHHLETVREKQLPGLPSQNNEKRINSLLRPLSLASPSPSWKAPLPARVGNKRVSIKGKETPLSAVRATCTARQLSLLTRGIPTWHHKGQRKTESSVSWAHCFRSSPHESASSALTAHSKNNGGKTWMASHSEVRRAPNGSCTY